MTGSMTTGARVTRADYGTATFRLLSDVVDRFENIRGGCGDCELFGDFHQAVVRRVDEIHRLIVASRIVTQQPDLERVLQLTVSRAKGLLAADMGGVLALANGDLSAELFLTEGFDEIACSVPDTLDLLRMPYREGVVIQADLGCGHPDTAEFLPTRPPVGSFLAVPLLREEYAIGTLFVANKPGGDRFSEEETLLLTAFAGQVVVLIDNERLHSQSRQLTLLQERQRLTQRLHNTVVQGLFTIGLQANWCLEHATLDHEVRKRLRDIQRLSAMSDCQLRGAIYALGNPYLPEGGSLTHILEDQITDYRRRSGIAAKLIVGPELPELGPEVSQAIYRIVCESLANVQKHAQAKAVLVTLRGDDGTARVTIEDDGIGLPELPDLRAATGTMHFGLEMMRQLATQLGGDLLVTNADDGGVMVRASFPLNEAEAS